MLQVQRDHATHLFLHSMEFQVSSLPFHVVQRVLPKWDDGILNLHCRAPLQMRNECLYASADRHMLELPFGIDHGWDLMLLGHNPHGLSLEGCFLDHPGACVQTSE